MLCVVFNCVVSMLCFWMFECGFVCGLIVCLMDCVCQCVHVVCVVCWIYWLFVCESVCVRVVVFVKRCAVFVNDCVCVGDCVFVCEFARNYVCVFCLNCVVVCLRWNMCMCVSRSVCRQFDMVLSFCLIHGVFLCVVSLCVVSWSHCVCVFGLPLVLKECVVFRCVLFLFVCWHVCVCLGANVCVYLFACVLNVCV